MNKWQMVLIGGFSLLATVPPVSAQINDVSFDLGTMQLDIPAVKPLDLTIPRILNTHLQLINENPMVFEFQEIKEAPVDSAILAHFSLKLGQLLAIPSVVVSGPNTEDRLYNALLKSEDNLLQMSLVGSVRQQNTGPLIRLTQIGRYDTGIFDDGAAEIVSFDANTQRLFVTNGSQASVDILALSDPTAPSLFGTIDVTQIGASANSVAIKNGIAAVAIENNDKQALGTVAFFNSEGQLLNQVTVGALPDMVTFTPDGQKVLVANEGEPNDDYTVDPEGSIGVIDLSNGVENATVMIADFTNFNDQQAELMAAGVRIFGPGATVAQDLEPEYITVSKEASTAWVSLQENNAIAIVDIETATVTDIVPLGFKDYSLPNNALDASDKDGIINIQSWPVWGLYQPDSIASIQIDGETYLVTANEGDGRDYEGFSEEQRVADISLDKTVFPNAEDLQQEANLGRLKITTTLGDIDNDGEFETLYAYGARSFSIWNSQGELIFDSANQFAITTAVTLGGAFNNYDGRSDDKGAEPEALTVGTVNGQTYAFIGLERTNGIMVYDISLPETPQLVQYVTDREFSTEEKDDDTSGDIAPEGMVFIPAEDSPNGKPLLVVANEVSGTTTIYQINTVDF